MILACVSSAITADKDFVHSATSTQGAGEIRMTMSGIVLKIHGKTILWSPKLFGGILCADDEGALLSQLFRELGAVCVAKNLTRFGPG